MRVIVVNDFAHVNGGAASVAVASAKGLARKGHQVSFFSAVGPVDPELREAGVNIICTGQHEILKDPDRFRAASQGLWNTAAARAFAIHVADVDCRDTVVHLHGWTKSLSSSVVRIAVKRGLRTVCTMHDYFVACPNGGFFDHQRLEHCSLRPLSVGCLSRNCDARAYSHKLWRCVRQIVQETAGGIPTRIDAFVVLSRTSRKVIGSYLPDGSRLFEIPNPVDVESDPPVDVARNLSFVMLGRLSPEKGGIFLARAARSFGAPVVFVGDGPSRPEIASANPAAIVTGWLTRAQVADHLSAARAIVFPSLGYEAQPLAVLEAAAKGVPAIVSNDCAAAEQVEDGVTGLLFKRGEEVALAAALRRLSDRELARRLGRAAYDKYWDNPLTLDRHVRSLEEMYGKVLSDRAA